MSSRVVCGSRLDPSPAGTDDASVARLARRPGLAAPTVRSPADPFADLPDPRLDRHQQHALLDLIGIAVPAIVGGADTWVEVEKFGRAECIRLKAVLSRPNGIPSPDTSGRVFAPLDPAAFGACFGTRMAAACARVGHVAIDGTAMRGSRGGPRGTGTRAFATAHGRALGRRAVADTSNGITAVPGLRKVLAISGALVATDAMGCRPKVADRVRGPGADYLPAVKAHRPAPHADGDRFVTAAVARGYGGIPHDFWAGAGRGTGRDEARACYVVPAAGVVTGPGGPGQGGPDRVRTGGGWEGGE